MNTNDNEIMPNTHLQNPTKALTRNDSIDILRGWLIVFVIIGHLVLGSVHDNVIRYSIYAFHMPLFIGLSGYLINPEPFKGRAMIVTTRMKKPITGMAVSVAGAANGEGGKR
jgi:peptidoglycan/LPS O-acetylase OafA/YrhL